MANQTCVASVQHQTVVAEPVDHDTFLSMFGEKDRKGIARHMAIWDEKLGVELTQRWYRFAHLLMAMAPHPAKFVAQQAIQFYVPDGKYRMQVFALQPQKDGALAVYAGNVLAEAIHSGLLAGPTDAGGNLYRVAKSKECLQVDELDRQTIDPDPVCKGMTGWHRRAICIRLPAHASNIQVETAESLCALSVIQWASAA